MADKENVPPVKKRRLSLSLSKNRFQKVSEEEVLEAERGFVPSNTRRCNNWAFKNFCLWLANSDDESYAETMFKEAGLNADKITNHSLRATATTRMIDAGIPEVIMDRTGHHSLDGLKPYCRTTDRLQQLVSKVISCSEVSVREQTTTVVEKKEICEKIKNGLVENYGEMSGCTFNISLNL